MAFELVSNKGLPQFKAAIGIGATAAIGPVPAPATILLEPGGGGTMTCKVRVTKGGTLIDLDAASYNADTLVVLSSPVAEIVCGAVTAAGDASVAWT